MGLPRLETGEPGQTGSVLVAQGDEKEGVPDGSETFSFQKTGALEADTSETAQRSVDTDERSGRLPHRNHYAIKRACPVQLRGIRRSGDGPAV